MKKLFILLFVLGLCVSSKAQVYTYKTYQYAYKQKNSYGTWNNWSNWEKSNLLMTINFNSDVVTIHSKKLQRYQITEFTRNFTDSSGGKQVEFRFIDQDGDIGNMRLRVETNGNSQIYIEFANLIWCYNVIRTN